MFHKRKVLTKEIIDGIMKNELAIWIWIQVDANPKPMQMVFPGQATLHVCGKKSYFTVPNADDKFYLKDFDYFWFVCENKPPEKEHDA